MQERAQRICPLPIDMINIDFSYNKECGKLKLTVSGHAGAAPLGQDIVCAAVSILVQTLAQHIKNIYVRGDLQKEPVIILEHGQANICCVPKKTAKTKLRHCFETVYTGFWLLAQTYPEYILLNIGL